MSHTIFSRISFALDLIRKGKFKSVIKGFTKKLYSETISFALKRDSNLEHKIPRAFVKFTFRLYKESDADYFVNDEDNITLIKQLPKCYVAITNEGIPFFRIWLLNSSQNKKMKEFWGDTFQELKDDEVLTESAFTTPKFRGLGIMPAAMALLAEEAKKKGKRYTITVTPITNINSLKATNYAGFKPYAIRKEKYFLFKKSVSYEETSNELMESYNEITSRKRKPKK